MKPKSMCKLLMTMEKGQPRIVGNEVELQFLIPAEHHDVFHDARPSAGHAIRRQLERVSVEVQRMDVVAGVAKPQPIAPASLESCASGFIASSENASPFRVQTLKPCAAALCLTIVISMVSSGAARVALGSCRTACSPTETAAAGRH